MPLFRLTEQSSQILMNQPESGMGYQIFLHEDRVYVAFNATVAMPLEELRTKRLSSIDYGILSGDPDKPGRPSVKLLSLNQQLKIIFSVFGTIQSDRELPLVATENATKPPEAAIPRTVPSAYYRYSSFFRDKRVNPTTGSFLPNTYATTYSDMRTVPSGMAAIGRYALPSPASARYLYQIVTYDRPGLIGAVSPNFGQAGGGVEVLFSKGAKNGPGLCVPIGVA